MSLVLLIKNGEEVYEAPLTAKPFLIGRSSSCNLKVVDEKVSGKHCAAHIEQGGRVIIKDLESSNGTFLNNSGIQEAYLYIDDEVTIGSILIWLDEERMTPKEKKLHTREGEKTQVNFIKFKGTGVVETETETNLQKAQAKQSLLKKEKQEKEAAAEAKSAQEELKNRVRAKGEEVDRNHGEIKDAMIQGETYEQEASSGKTRFIKIDKDQGKKKISEARKKRQKEKDSQKKSIVDKVMGIFKK